MIVGPRYNDSDPAVEAAYERAAETETAMSGEPECGFPEGWALDLAAGKIRDALAPLTEGETDAG